MSARRGRGAASTPDQSSSLDLSNFHVRLEELIVEELPHLQHLDAPVLHLEGVIRDSAREVTTEPSQAISLGTVDLRRWTRDRTSHGTGLHTPTELDQGTTAGEPSQPPDDSPPQQASGSLPQQASATHRPKRRRKAGAAPEYDPESSPPHEDTCQRQLHSSIDAVPQRRKPDYGADPQFRPSSLDKLISGIWEQIHSGIEVTLPAAVSETVRAWPTACVSQPDSDLLSIDFGAITKTCHLVSCAGRSFRALEIVVQALWIECFNARTSTLAAERPGCGSGTINKAALMEACKEFGWSEKELRNKMAIWKGYYEIKEAAGWAALVFAGAGIYRYCKYRVGFDSNSLSKLSRHRSRFEVAADTIQPQWRGLLSLLLGKSRCIYRGHPHDWSVGKFCDPLPLAWTYRKCDPDFAYEHITESILDIDAWGGADPRRLSSSEKYICTVCQDPQSNDAEANRCQCFPDLFGPLRGRLPPVQIFQTKDGRDNGLLACCAFDRGAVIGEFIGTITKGLENKDVMCSRVDTPFEYQIWQGRKGNYTRFINHSCLPNAQFETFSWLGMERVIIVSKGVAADSEITVDYSGRYWSGLDKQCLCGHGCCRYAGEAR